MSTTEPEAKIIELKQAWDQAQPLSGQNEKRLWEKLRLEWNFNSNHIEGNTLSYGETELLLIHDRTTGNHDLREYEEMKAHDVAINHVYKLARDSRPLTEADIRDLNQISLKEAFWKEAVTPDGKPTRKEIIPGEYKTTPNNVRTASGQIFEFAAPLDVPSKMAEFVATLNGFANDASARLPALLAKLHHDFVLIHPFDDGNGRVARLLVNYVLLRKGFLPIVIKSSEKKSYISALQEADAGNIAPFERYLGDQLIWSLNLGLQASRGGSLEEPSDIEKQIALFAKAELQSIGKPSVQKKSNAAILDLYNISWKPLFLRIFDKTETIRALFDAYLISVNPGPSRPGDNWADVLERALATGHHAQILYQFNGYKGSASFPFNLGFGIMIQLDDYNYQFIVDGLPVVKKLYSEPITSDEGDVFIQNLLKKLFQQIQTNAKRT